MGTPWPPAALAPMDTETTSPNPEEARVVEISLVLIRPGAAPDIRTQIVNPGVPIPPEATKVHGIDDARAQAEGKPPADVLDLFVADMALALRAGLPLVIQNAPYDLTVLDRDCRRHDVPTLSDRLDGQIAPVLDPLVLDKRCIKMRRRVSEDQGARCLKTLAQVYGVPWDDERAHGAEYDCMQAARVIWRMGQWSRKPVAELTKMRLPHHDWPMHRNDAAAFASLADLDLMELHKSQRVWYAEQAESFRQYLRREANELRHRISETPTAGTPAEQDLAELEARIDSLDACWPICVHEPQGASS